MAIISRMLIAAGLCGVATVGALKTNEDWPRRGERRKRARKGRHGEEKQVALSGGPLPSFLMVSGYWELDESNADSGHLRAGPGSYIINMKWTMTLHAPTVIYGDEFGTTNMVKARGNNTAPLVGVHVTSLDDAEPCKSHSQQLRENPSFWTHPQDCPSISLGCIWNGKMGILSDAARRHPGYDLYAWVDIGMHASKAYVDTFRAHGDLPWPHPSKLAKLPLDKVSISHSGLNCDKMQDRPWEFWHCAAATAFVVPAQILPKVHKMFYEKLEQCIQFWSDGHTHAPEKGGTYGGYACLSEQMIMSVMARENPGMFHWIGHGWGAAAANLTTDKLIFQGAPSEQTELMDWLGSSPEESATKI